MSEIAKAFSRFIMRDVVFILGGGSLIISFLYAVGHLNYIMDLNIIFYIFGAALAYTIGYATQDVVSLSKLTTTAVDPFPIPRIIQKLYLRFTRKTEWPEIGPYDHNELMMTLPEEFFAYISPRYERIVSLRQIGTTMGPCLILTGVFIFLRLFIRGEFLPNEKMFAFILFPGLLVLGVFLIFLGWLKTAQVVIFWAQVNSLKKTTEELLTSQVAQEKPLMRSLAEKGIYNEDLLKMMKLVDSEMRKKGVTK